MPLRLRNSASPPWPTIRACRIYPSRAHPPPIVCGCRLPSFRGLPPPPRLSPLLLRNDHHAVVIGDHHVARMHQGAGANDGRVDRSHRGLHGTLGVDGFCPDRKAHTAQLRHISTAGVNHQPDGAARAKRGRQQIAEHAVGVLRGGGEHRHVPRLQQLCGHVQHPVITGVRENRNGGSARLRSRIDGPHIRCHQA